MSAYAPGMLEAISEHFFPTVLPSRGHMRTEVSFLAKMQTRETASMAVKYLIP